MARNHSPATRRLLPACLIAALGIVASLPGGMSAAGASASSPASPLAAVRMVVRPYYVPGYNFANCTRRSPRRYPKLTCPETARLRRRLQRLRDRFGFGGLPFCRCQSGPRTVLARQINNNGRVAHVNAWWDLGRVESFTDTFVVVRRGRGWLVDNEYCAGRPGTTIYGPRGDSPCH